MAEQRIAKEVEGDSPPLEQTPHSINEPPGSDVLPPDPDAPPDTGEAPVLSGLIPASCTISDPDFTLEISGTGLSADSVIVFAGNDEPTTYDEVAGSVSTLVKPSLWQTPVTVDCSVRNGEAESNLLQFEFLPAAGG